MAKPAKKIPLDFTDVEGGGRPVPDGEYLLKCKAVEETESSTGNPMLKMKWTVAEGEYSGGLIYDNVSLTPQALWRLKGLLECIGISATGKIDLEPQSMVGKLVVCDIENETYNSKERPKIIGFLRGVEDKKPAAAASSAPSSTVRQIKKPAATAAGPAVGSQVSFDNDGEVITGKLSSLVGQTATVQVDVNGEVEEWELDISELRAAA